jgi:phospholipase/lecithinase/hemolysin
MIFGSLVQYDEVHPTEEGYRLMAEAIMNIFEAL